MNLPTEPWAIERINPETDLDRVLEIDADAFRRPWSRPALEQELARSDVVWMFVIRAPEEPVVGYCSIWLIFDELHINSLAVRESWRRRGVARAMLAFVLDTAKRAGASRATLEVRRSNTAAMGLYADFGFVVAGNRPGYYTDPREDALVLWREGSHPA